MKTKKLLVTLILLFVGGISAFSLTNNSPGDDNPVDKSKLTDALALAKQKTEDTDKMIFQIVYTYPFLIFSFFHICYKADWNLISVIRKRLPLFFYRHGRILEKHCIQRGYNL